MHAISTIASALLTWTLLLSSGQLKAQDFTQPFKPDPNTVVLYHFDEGQGDETRDACGDPELTLRAHKEALWGSRAGFGATARFLRREDDANVLVGPVDNPKLELRGCTREWTIEAWVRHTGGSEQNGYRNICGSDDDGTPIEPASEARLTIRATDEIGHSDQHVFTLSVRPGHITTESLPLAFTGHSYRHRLESEYMREPVRWRIRRGTLPEGLGFDRASGVLSGTPTSVIRTPLTVEAVDGLGAVDTQELIFRAVPEALRQIAPDKHTVALWNWQGPGSRRVADLRGDEELTLTWINLKGETRLPRPNWGRYPYFIGGGEGGFVGPRNNQKLDLRTCKTAWTVEAWVRPGGSVDGYGRKVDFGHICGTYDNSGLGVWELYLSNHNSPNGSFSPGVHFLGAEPEQSLQDLHPWSRPEGIVADPKEVGIQDTRWHHVAWQYGYVEDLHQLFLDGRLIWQMKSPDGRSLVNNRRHHAQFSVGTRLTGYARLGGNFNWLGKGNFFGQIGEIRISDVRRYGGEAKD